MSVTQADRNGAVPSLVLRLRRAAQMGVFARCKHPVGIVLAAIACGIDARGRCVVHPRLLAAELGLSVPTVNRALAEASGLGFVVDRRRRRVGTVVTLSLLVLGAVLAVSDRASAAVRSDRRGRFLSRFSTARAVVAARVEALLRPQEKETLVSQCCAHRDPIQPEARPEVAPNGADRASEGAQDYLARVLRERREGLR